MRYLFDSNAVISLLNNKSSQLVQRAKLHEPSEIGISAIVIHELFYGAFKSQRLKHNLDQVDNLPFEVLDFDKADARQAGEIRALLATKGTPIGPYDVLIAGQARGRSLTLITSNTKEFSRISGLSIENWEI